MADKESDEQPQRQRQRRSDPGSQTGKNKEDEYNLPDRTMLVENFNGIHKTLVSDPTKFDSLPAERKSLFVMLNNIMLSKDTY